VSELHGIAASPGAGIGAVLAIGGGELVLPAGSPPDRAAERARLPEALEAVAADLEARAARSGGELGDILEAEAMMARDPELLATAEAAVDAGGWAAAAILAAGERYAEVLAASESEYLAARADDVRDVCRRAARRLAGIEDAASMPDGDGDLVLVASDVAPADVADLDLTRVRGIATEAGGRTSHTTIVARALGIPAVVAVDGLLGALSGARVAGVDGDRGVVLLDPPADAAAELRDRARRRAQRREELQRIVASGPAGTRDGHRIEFAANVGAAEEIAPALAAGAQGVGLFRTELLYLDRTAPPSREEQRRVFAAAISALGDRPLVVRTFDFGADKPVAFADAPPTPNPALGVRGLRLARARPELLDDQLAALADAALAAGRRVSVMAPMVTTADDAAWFAERVRAVAGPDLLEAGAMIEVPSAALLAAEILDPLDFASIGTNDLTQYVLAADRQEAALAELQDPFSPAVLRAVDLVCRGAERAGAWVGVCGEAAADPDWAAVAVGLGVTELSMGGDAVLEVRAALGTLDHATCRDAAAAAVAAPDAATARLAARDRTA
jgi:phosphotransferase system enzyme I (PtsI)